MPEATPEQNYALINEFLKRFGTERNLDLAPLSEDGVAQVQRGSAVVSIHVLPAQGILLLLSKVMPVPEKNREDLYRRLLELSFLATGDAAFSINKKTDEIFLRCMRRLDGLDYEEFEDLVHTTATVADEWDNKLEGEFAEEG
jgi:hypothetical protein